MNTPRNVIAIAGVAASIGLGASVVAAESLFGTPIPFDTPPFNYNEGPPPSVAIGDLDADGKLDLVIATAVENGGLSVLLGNGDGTFRPRRDYSLGWGWGNSVALGDLDGDGLLDVVSGSDDGALRVLFGRGDGTVGSAIVIAQLRDASAPFFATTGDVDDDGRLDVIAADGALQVFLGNGDRTFRHVENEPMPASFSLALADLDGDGTMDLATVERHSCCDSNLRILLGKGDGTFSAGAAVYGGSRYLTSVVIADLDDDETPDLVAADTDQGFVSEYLGGGSGTFGDAVSHIAYYSWSYYYPYLMGQLLAVGDLNNDGRPDVAAGDQFSSYGSGHAGLRVWLRNEDGTLGEYTIYGRSSQVTAIADLDGDGRMDLIGSQEVLLNVGPFPAIDVRFEIHPDTVNLGAHRPSLSAVIDLPEPYDASQVDVASIRLNRSVAPVESCVVRGARTSRTLRIQFAGTELMEVLEPGPRVATTVSGIVAGRQFTGTDHIRVTSSIGGGWLDAGLGNPSRPRIADSRDCE